MPPSSRILRIVLAVPLLLSLIAAGVYGAGRPLWAAWQYRAAQEAVQRRDFAEADRRLQKCVDISPDDLDYRLLAARMARRRNDYAQARQHLTVYREQGGVTEVVAQEQKLADVQRGAFDGVDSLLAACERHPEAAETPWILEAVIAGSEAGLDGASAAHAELPPIKFLDPGQRAAELWLRCRHAPVDQVQGLVWRARFLFVRGNGPTGLADLRRAVAIAPDDFEPRYRLALGLEQLEPNAAAEHLEILRRQFPDDDRVYLPLAAVRRSLGQLDEACDLLDRALAIHPDDAAALLARGELARDTQRPEEAEPWLRRVWALQPDDPETNFALSRCLQLLGRVEEANKYDEHSREMAALARKKAKPAAQP